MYIKCIGNDNYNNIVSRIYNYLSIEPGIELMNLNLLTIIRYNLAEFYYKTM